MEGFTEGGGDLGPCNSSHPFLSDEYSSGTSHTVESTLSSSYKQEFLPLAPVLGGERAGARPTSLGWVLSLGVTTVCCCPGVQGWEG